MRLLLAASAIALSAASPVLAQSADKSGDKTKSLDALHSEAMIEQLRRKPGRPELPVSVGDFADVAVDGVFRLIYVVFNTFYSLLSQAEQVRCFRNVAARLGGNFGLWFWRVVSHALASMPLLRSLFVFVDRFL